MFTILQRQHVSRRTTPPVLSRARTDGVRWSRRELAAPRGSEPTTQHRPDRPLSILRLQAPRRLRLTRPRREQPRARVETRDAPRGETRRFLRDQLVRRTRGSAERREERRARRDAEKLRARVQKAGPPGPAGHRRALLSGMLHNPLIAIVLAVVAAAAILVPALGTAGIGVPRSVPVLPTNADADSALYDLMVPAPDPRTAAGSSPVLLNRLSVRPYRTVAGDTLSRIAARFKLSIDSVVSWNGIRDARSIPAGTELSIPSRNGLKYTVRRGDTLQGIARAWGVDFNGILDANMLSSSVITAGQNLFLPDARMNPNDLNRILGNLFTYPVQGRISSYFGERSEPFTGVLSFHNGIDIVNRPGMSIGAAMAGAVRAVGFNFNYGNYVILQHSGGYQTLYGHLSHSSVGKGQRVSQGQKIGELGSTGYSTGPHLHFSIFRNGEAVDPLRFLK